MNEIATPSDYHELDVAYTLSSKQITCCRKARPEDSKKKLNSCWINVARRSAGAYTTPWKYSPHAPGTTQPFLDIICSGRVLGNYHNKCRSLQHVPATSAHSITVMDLQGPLQRTVRVVCNRNRLSEKHHDNHRTPYMHDDTEGLLVDTLYRNFCINKQNALSNSENMYCHGERWQGIGTSTIRFLGDLTEGSAGAWRLCRRHELSRGNSNLLSEALRSRQRSDTWRDALVLPGGANIRVGTTEACRG